jgi:hypothetical protein
MRNEKAIDWRERILTTSIGQREQAQGGSYGKLGKKNFYLVFFGEKEDECVKGKLIIMCEELMFMKANVLTNRRSTQVQT